MEHRAFYDRALPCLKRDNAIYLKLHGDKSILPDSEGIIEAINDIILLICEDPKITNDIIGRIDRSRNTLVEIIAVYDTRRVCKVCMDADPMRYHTADYNEMIVMRDKLCDALMVIDGK
jgi:hypothetical protein